MIVEEENEKNENLLELYGLFENKTEKKYLKPEFTEECLTKLKTELSKMVILNTPNLLKDGFIFISRHSNRSLILLTNNVQK